LQQRVSFLSLLSSPPQHSTANPAIAINTTTKSEQLALRHQQYVCAAHRMAAYTVVVSVAQAFPMSYLSLVHLATVNADVSAATPCASRLSDTMYHRDSLPLGSTHVATPEAACLS
jgi:hypothetical protein